MLGRHQEKAIYGKLNGTNTQHSGHMGQYFSS